jgi:cytochrome P450
MTMNAAITDKDARYDEMFQVENETAAFGTGLIDDPYPAWAKMLAQAPVLQGTLPQCMGLPPEWSGHFYRPGPTYYTAVSFAAVSEAFTDKDNFSSQFYVDIGIEQQLGDTILSMDGQRHRHYRDLIQAHFQPGAAAGWWSERVIRGAVEQLISSIERNGRADLNADFFARLPMHVVTAGFGLSPDQGLAFRHNMQIVVSHKAADPEKAEALKNALGILETVIRERQAEPQDDIISKLTQAQLKEADGGTRPLTVMEIMGFCRLIVFAGGGTTWRQLGITTFALLNNPGQLDELKANRGLIQNAILESTRWHTTDPLFPRKVMKDTVLQGVELPKDAVLHLCLGAANHDPSRWENPDKFDIHRPIQRSMAFAAGAHSCLGQHVARQEIAVTLNAILDRLPNVRWDDSKPAPKIMGGLIGRGPGPLHVVFG